MVPLPVVPTKDKTLVLSSNFSSRESSTATDVKLFKNWLRRHGFVAKQTYPYRHWTHFGKRHRSGESIRRASTWIGSGTYQDISISILDRITLPHDMPTRYQGRGGLSGDGHHREDDSIISTTSISCFVNSTNLLGWYGISWQDIMAGDLHLLMRLRQPSMTGYDRYVLGKSA